MVVRSRYQKIGWRSQAQPSVQFTNFQSWPRIEYIQTVKMLSVKRVKDETVNMERPKPIIPAKELPQFDRIVKTQAMCYFKVPQGTTFEWIRTFQMVMRNVVTINGIVEWTRFRSLK
eukprot:TRINITY_DN2408_c0_g4_i7.p1 TRINITY_DN2408_c0_g4~~TRINITY_DN2408_c0_g4_i7.p1  ORF type:complete len:117 (+),score=5.84 TRINITY_DN2408_c0_g4_i7:305-655(+)